MRVLIAGGGTAGHVFPALALARRLSVDGRADVRFAGTGSGQEARLVTQAGFPFVPVEARPLERRVSLRAVTVPMTVLRSVRRCRPLVEDVDVVVGMGGYVSVPVALAAIRAHRPLVLHEQNAVPGLANRTLARPARCVALSFAEAGRMLPRRATSIVTGNPVREEIVAVRMQREALAREAAARFELRRDRVTVLIFGGSQGALHLDRAALDALRLLDGRGDLQVLLLTGPAHIDEVNRALPSGGGLLVRTLPFLDRMDLAYALADLVVSRAGATTCAEVTVAGLPSLLIPYPYATGRHQEANARALQRAGAATIVMDDALTGGMLAARLSELLDHPDRLSAMAARSAGWGTPRAADALAEVVIDAGGAR